MDKQEIIGQAQRIKDSLNTNTHGGLAQTKEFLQTYGGKDNHFLQSLDAIKGAASLDFVKNKVFQVLTSFQEYVQNGLLRSMSLEREIQIETVSDYLELAENLLNDKKVHAAAPAVIIGASLEEFLRNWLEDDGFDLSTIKNSLDAYSTQLKKEGKISKQDLKDIVSWGGTRNDAAHGHWDNVKDKNRIRLMLEGVNLFMRKYSS